MSRACALALLRCPVDVKEEEARRLADREWKRATIEYHSVLEGSDDQRWEARARFLLLRKAVIALAA